MDEEQFDSMARSLTGGTPRRRIAMTLGGSLLALSSLMGVGRTANAKKKGKGNKKGDKDKKNQKRTTYSIVSLDESPPSPPPPGTPPLQLAGSCDAASFGSTGGGPNSRSAQTFAASRSGTLQQIRVAINKDAGSSGDCLVQLVLSSASGPSNLARSVIAASTIADADVPAGDSVLVANFASTPIQAGQGYAVVVTRLNGGILNVQLGTGSSCPNTKWFNTYGTNEFIDPGLNVAMIFSVFVV